MGYILQQVEKPPERKNEDSDDEGGEEEEDAEEVEEFEADLDISDCFPIPPKKDYLLDYVIDRPIPAFDQMKDSNEVFRPTTPGQRRLLIDNNTISHNNNNNYVCIKKNECYIIALVLLTRYN